jgi:hypothetical protein
MTRGARGGLLWAGLLTALAALFWLRTAADIAPHLAPFDGPLVSANEAGPTVSAKAARPPTEAMDRPRMRQPASAMIEGDDDVWDLCGVGRLPHPVGASGRSSGSVELPGHLGADATATAMDRLMQRLDAGGPRQRAAAVMLRGSDAQGQDAAQALSQLAAASADPVVASWLMMRCGGQARCADDDLQRWAVLEPDNLAAWLALADQQPERQAEVVRRAPEMARFETHQGKLLDVVMQAMPPDVPPYVQLKVWMHAIGVEAAAAVPPPGPLLASCQPRPEAGSARQRACAGMARVLVEHGDSSMGRLAGLKLAELGGAPAAAVQAQRQQLNAALRSAQGLFDERQPLSCASHARVQAWLQLRAQMGELGALQSMAAADAASPAAPL